MGRLLNAFADLEAREAAQGDVGAEFLRQAGAQGFDGLVGVESRSLARASRPLWAHLASLPSMILGRAASGLPSSISWASKIAACLLRASAGISETFRNCGDMAAICIALSSTNFSNAGALAAASLPVRTASRTPTLPPVCT